MARGSCRSNREHSRSGRHELFPDRRRPGRRVRRAVLHGANAGGLPGRRRDHRVHGRPADHAQRRGAADHVHRGAADAKGPRKQGAWRSRGTRRAWRGPRRNRAAGRSGARRDPPGSRLGSVCTDVLGVNRPRPGLSALPWESTDLGRDSLCCESCRPAAAAAARIVPGSTDLGRDPCAAEESSLAVAVAASRSCKDCPGINRPRPGSLCCWTSRHRPGSWQAGSTWGR